MHFYIIFLWKEIKSCAANVSSVSVFIVNKCCQVVSTSNVMNSNLMVIYACCVQRNSSLDVLMSNLNTFLQSITKRKYIPAKMPCYGIPWLMNIRKPKNFTKGQKKFGDETWWFTALWRCVWRKYEKGITCQIPKIFVNWFYVLMYSIWEISISDILFEFQLLLANCFVHIE